MGTYSTMDKLAEVSDDTADRAQSAAKKFGGRLRDQASKVRDKSEQLSENFVGFVRERPFTTLGIGAAAALLLGMFLRRK